MQNKLNFLKKGQQNSNDERASADALFSDSRKKAATYGNGPIHKLTGREAGGIALDKLLLFVIIGSVCLFVVYPLLCIALRSFQGDEGSFTLTHYLEALGSYQQTLWNSIFVASLSALFCTIFSVASALVVSTSKGWVRVLGLAVLLITMISPPFVGSLAYIQLYGRRGWITHGLLGLTWNPYNKWGVILMQSVSFVPMNALFLNGILSKIDGDSIKSARDLGASQSSILKDIVLPQMKPGILVCLLLSFIRSLSDYGTPLIIGGRFTTIASDIYYQLTGYADLEKAAVLNMFLLLPSVAAFFLYRYLLKQCDALSAASRGKQGGDMGLNLRRCGPLGLFVGASSFLFFFMMVLQYICIFSMGFIKVSKKGNSFTLQYLEQLLKTDLRTMTRSITYAFIVSFVGTFFAMLFAYYMERRKVPFRRTLDCMVTLPYMLPGTCFGIGYILAFNHKPLKLTGTALIVIACMIFKQLPTCTKVCSATLKQVPHSLERAVHDLGGGQIAVIRDVILPGLRPAFLSCFANNFSSSMTTAGAIIFLIDPARKLAVFKLFDAVYTGDYAVAALIATLIIIIVLAVEAVVYWITAKLSGKNAGKAANIFVS